MKRVLVYGDSNVWGDHFGGRRLPENVQWVNILAQKLGDGYQIIQEGLNGRLASGDADQANLFKNGQTSFVAIWRTAAPVDIVIIALGTNDLQTRYHQSPEQIASSLDWYQQTLLSQFNDAPGSRYFVNDEQPPSVIYLLPPYFDPARTTLLDEASQQKRLQLNQLMATAHDVIDVAVRLPLFDDGVHLTPAGHQQMAKAVYRKLVSS